MSPVFLFAIPGLWKLGKLGGWPVALSCLLGVIPILLWVSTGWVEFGPRLTLDITVPLMVATAAGVSSRSTRTIARLSLFSMVMYLPGTIVMAAVYG